MLLVGVLLVAACGSANPTPGFQAVLDEPAAATEASGTTTTTLPNLHVIDPTARNPFEPFAQP